MKSTLFRAVPAAFAVLVIAGGATAAALAVGRDDHRIDDAALETSPAHEVEDRGPDDLSRGSDHDTTDPTAEDRPLRHEVRRDEDRVETLQETFHSGTETYAVAGAGTVTVRRDGPSLSIVDVAAASGWTPLVERSHGYEVEVTLRGDGQRIDFSAEIEHDRVKTRVRER